MNGGGYALALLDKALGEAALRAYVESGDAGRDVAQAWASAEAFDRAFAEYRKQHPAN